MRYLIRTVNNYFTAPAVTAMLIVCGFYITAKLRFIYITKVKVILKVLTRKSTSGISPLRTLTVALAGTLGVGNIVGVAYAICAGGPGSIFWMWVGALLSMSIKYSEVVLALKYRRREKGSYVGGAMYYIKSKKLALLFAFLCVLASFTLGNLMQMNALSSSFKATFDFSPLVLGAICAVAVYIIICRSFRCISAVTVVLIPFACLAYLLICLYIIIENICYIPTILWQIVRSAFSLKAVGAGGAGYCMARAIRHGISRGLITNEAGCGTAPMAHAQSDCRSPVEQGFWGIFEVFTDTVLLCSATAFVLLLSFDATKLPSSSMELVIKGFSLGLGELSAPVIAAFMALFAFATILGWAHYGKTSLLYLTSSKKAQKLYFLLYSFCTLFGVFMSEQSVFTLTDIIISLMTLINMFFVMLKMPVVKELTDDYFISPSALK